MYTMNFDNECYELIKVIRKFNYNEEDMKETIRNYIKEYKKLTLVDDNANFYILKEIEEANFYDIN